MDSKLNAYLYDVLQAIQEIESFIVENMSLEVYRNDTKTKRAVERNLEIIGEAINRIVKFYNS